MFASCRFDALLPDIFRVLKASGEFIVHEIVSKSTATNDLRALNDIIFSLMLAGFLESADATASAAIGTLPTGLGANSQAVEVQPWLCGALSIGAFSWLAIFF